MPAGDVLVQFLMVQKTYDGAVLVVKHLDLDIHRGEFLTLLGPSGAGKTTTLMMLAGFEMPTHGEIRLGDRGAVHLRHLVRRGGGRPDDRRARPEHPAARDVHRHPRELNPTITAIATVLILFSVVMLLCLEALRRRSERMTTGG